MATQRGWPSDAISCEQYYESFVSGGGDFAQQWMYFDSDRLVGVALMDETPQSISLVYFFHEPCWRPLSPGLFSVLTQLDYAREQGKRHAYPGYWISENTSMAYKARFRPFERLVSISSPGMEPIWLEDGLRSILSA
jgi:arginine-tRNA-protein transferase